MPPETDAVPADDAGIGHTHVASNGKVQLTLDELAAMQPGMARLMVEVADRMWKCYHAGQARNRPLARYELSEAVKVMKIAATVRPRYAESMRSFLDGEIASLRAVIEGERWEALEEAFSSVVGAANGYHEQYGKGFLVWKVPEDEPRHLDLRPRD